MKNSVNLDRLFQKASEAPVQTSFDETKQAFVDALAAPPSVGKKSLHLKNWIIMFSLLISALVALNLFFFEKEVPNQKEVPANHWIDSITEVSTNKSNEIAPPVVINKPREAEKEVPVLPLFPLPLNSLKKRKSPIPLAASYYNLAQDRREKNTEIEIPILTEEDISANEKRKKKMMKALAKRDKNVYAYVPSSSFDYKGQQVSVNAFYMQTNEVTNEEYRTFLTDLLIQRKTEDWKKAYPQEEQWSNQIDGDVRAMQTLYFNHPAYANYPVVNITREGAEMYCKWLTRETSASKYVENPKSLNDVRIPQRMEWVSAAKAGNSENTYPCGSSTQNEEKCYLVNYKIDSTHFHGDGAFFTAKTSTYNPDSYGIYNLAGNVAEMVYGTTETDSRSDLLSYNKSFLGTAGGGWMDGIDALAIEAEDPYSGITEGHPNIGFRVVMTYLRE